MSSADIDEMYEKLLQKYEIRYGTGNPAAKACAQTMLEYHIKIEETKKGRTREEAIKTIFEEEATIRQIDDYERTIKRLTLLFSKGEMSEESYTTAIKSIEEKLGKFPVKDTRCPQCGEKVPKLLKLCPHCGSKSRAASVGRSSPLSYTRYTSAPTKWWYLVPLLFGLIGGLIGYVAVRDDDKYMANNLLWIGIIITGIGIICYWLISLP